MTSDVPPKHNLQLQVNHEPEESTLKPFAPNTCAISFVDSVTPKTAQEIRDDLFQPSFHPVEDHVEYSFPVRDGLLLLTAVTELSASDRFD